MRLLVAEEVAEMLRVRPATVLDWARRGAIPHLRVGRSVRFSEPELRRWIAAQHGVSEGETEGLPHG